MCFEFAFLLPKILGLFLVGVWFYTSLRKLWMYKHADKVTGTVINIANNPEASSALNKIATVEFAYLDKTFVIEHYFPGTKNDMAKEVDVYVNKRNVERSVVKLGSKGWFFVMDFIGPAFIFILILISFFRSKAC